MTAQNVGSTQTVIHIHTRTFNGSPIIFSNSTGLGGKLGHIICMIMLIALVYIWNVKKWYH